MKNIRKPISLFIGLIFMGCAGNHPIIESKISVPTIQCDMCEHNIHTALENVDGMKKLIIDPISKTATVQYDSSLIKLENVESYISQSGYQANDLKPDYVAYKKLNLCCKMQNIK